MQAALYPNVNPVKAMKINWSIVRVDPKGPLGKVGFEVGDIIAAINGQPVEGLEGFDGLVSMLKPGQKIALLGVDHRTGNSGYVKVVVR